MATQAEVAEKLGLSDRWLRKLVEEGAIKDPGRGKWDALATARQLLEYRGKEIESLKALVASLESQAQRSESGGIKAVEDARLQRAKADIAEMEAAERRGELIPRAQIADALHSAIIIMKTRLNATPAKVAPLAHAAPSVAVAERHIREQVDDALDGLGKVEARERCRQSTVRSSRTCRRVAVAAESRRCSDDRATSRRRPTTMPLRTSQAW